MATDNAVIRRDVSTGKVQESLATIDDNGTMNIPTGQTYNINGSEHTHAGGSGIASGTSFPGSPATNDLYFRTDRGLLYFYDGTRWLTVTLYEHHLCLFNNATTTASAHTAVWEDNYDVYVVDLIATMFTASGSSGTAYWTMSLYFWDGATQGSAITTVNNQSAADATFVRKKSSINALMGTAKDAVEIGLGKTSTPGAFYGSAFLTYRLVG